MNAYARQSNPKTPSTSQNRDRASAHVAAASHPAECGAHRPEGIAQPQWPATVNQSPRVVAQAQWRALIDHSPRQAAQRLRMERLFGPSVRRHAGPAGDALGTPTESGTPEQQGMSSIKQAPAVIQRRMGFEFETGAHIYRTDHHWNELVADEADIFQGAGWKLVSDSGRMEFVSDPFDNLGSFGPIITAITNFITNASVALNTDIRALNAGNWLAPAVGAGASPVYTSEDENNTVAVNALTFYGNPQVSVGTRLESLGRFLSRIRTDDTMRSLRRKLHGDLSQPGAATPAHATGTRKRIRKVGKLLGRSTIDRTAFAFPKAEILYARHVKGNVLIPVADRHKLRSIWQLMGQYWSDLSKYQGEGYLKAQLPVMARTDFHSMYLELTPAARQAFAAAAGDFTGKNIPVRQQGFRQGLITGHNFTVADWYDSVITPAAFNPVPQHTFQGLTRNVDLVSNDQTVARGTNKSMGQFGMDTWDPAVSRAVFELRHVTGGVRIHISDLDPHVLTPVFNLLASVNA